MRTLFGALAGALALVVVLVAYDLGERRSFSRDMTPMPTTQTVIGPDGVARTYLVPAGQAAYGQAPYGQVPYGTLQNGWSPYASAAPGMISPYGAYPVQAQYVTDGGVVTQQPVVRRVSQRSVAVRRVSSGRSWQKSALLIGGSAGAGAGLGGLLGGKKGALSGAALGGGIAALIDQAQRH